MYSIQLKNLSFYAFHGIYPEEQVLGTQFLVSIDVQTSIQQKAVALLDTIDYVSIVSIVEHRMKLATPLLETLAADIVEMIALLDNRITLIDITITKKRPPIDAFVGDICVRYKKSYA